MLSNLRRLAFSLFFDANIPNKQPLTKGFPLNSGGNSLYVLVFRKKAASEHFLHFGYNFSHLLTLIQ